MDEDDVDKRPFLFRPWHAHGEETAMVRTSISTLPYDSSPSPPTDATPCRSVDNLHGLEHSLRRRVRIWCWRTQVSARNCAQG
jgi:hypothetical protein